MSMLDFDTKAFIHSVKIDSLKLEVRECVLDCLGLPVNERVFRLRDISSCCFSDRELCYVVKAFR
jgi:hypothetical protein